MKRNESSPGEPARPTYWRSPEQLERQRQTQRDGLSASDHDHQDDHHHPGQHEAELVLDPVARRDFLGLMGASFALAGVTLGGCVRKPREHILPYTRRPEDMIPGKPRYFATAAQLGDSVLGLLVESQDGRPTKIEGNPEHPNSLGATNVFAQSSVLDLYASDRPKQPRIDSREVSLEQLDVALAAKLEPIRANQGAGLAILLQDVRSPTSHELLARIRRSLPRARAFVHDCTRPRNTQAGASMVGIPGLRALYDIAAAERVLALDADFLGTEGDSVRHARAFASRRGAETSAGEPSRLYVVEPSFTVTGMNADNRLRLAASLIPDFLADLVADLAMRFDKFPDGTAPALAKLVQRRDSPFARWVKVVSDDLMRHRSLVIVGERQPAEAHALGHLANSLLRALTHGTVRYVPDAMQGDLEPIDELVRELDGNRVELLAIIGGNPAYDTPAELRFSERMARAHTCVHLCAHENETSARATWVIPQCHFLEAWGDLQALDGTLSIQQPLIAPLHASISAIELLARLAGGETDGYSLVRETWTKLHGELPAVAAQPFEATWRRALHDGLLTATDVTSSPTSAPQAAALTSPVVVMPQLRWQRLGETLETTRRAAPSGDAPELVFQLDAKVLDGRFAGNAWLQELPEPVTKLTWDNALLVGVGTAKRLGLESGQIYTLTVGERAIEVVPFVTPGVADNCLVLSLGYGRTKGGQVAEGRGFNAFALQAAASPWFVRGAKLRRRRGHYALASTQEHGSMTEPDLAGRPGRERPVLRESTLEAYRRDPLFAQKGQLKIERELLPDEQLNSLWNPPNARGGQQWGMTIDLSSCLGCNACTIACQAENNIPVAGKERVLNGREMHWIRLDRYYKGQDDEVLALPQPMACVHCETAPCESVCPVAATVHSPEGLNEMAYNRCIGTRYCSNNCPYKVRRFNFFNYQKENDVRAPLEAMQHNPDVTVRFRGVMEKCTYCVQRINQAKIAAKVEGEVVDGEVRVADGEIVTACQQACPTQAIAFGDLNDPQSRVAKLKKLERNYAVLADLNTHPRTTYLARIRNPHPDLV